MLIFGRNTTLTLNGVLVFLKGGKQYNMNEIDYKRFYEKVGKANGWDFSRLNVTSEGALWDFNEEIKKRAKSSNVLLDIGTGGGENVLSIAALFVFLVGIDLSDGMIETAKSNLKRTDISNVRFSQMSSEELRFPSGFFDIVTCRHAPFNAKEVAKVLKKGGCFLTQQVAEGDKLNIIKAFNRTTVVDQVESLQVRYVRELKKAGFCEIQYYESDATEYYQSPEDLIFLLKHTPIIPNFGMEEHDFARLNDFIVNNRTEKGIQTNSKRFLIIAIK